MVRRPRRLIASDGPPRDASKVLMERVLDVAEQIRQVWQPTPQGR